jgi:hypothetical protein
VRTTEDLERSAAKSIERRLKSKEDVQMVKDFPREIVEQRAQRRGHVFDLGSVVPHDIVEIVGILVLAAAVERKRLQHDASASSTRGDEKQSPPRPITAQLCAPRRR